MTAIQKLKKLMRSHPHLKSALAAKLNLSSTSTIDKWLKAEEIPKLRKMQVLIAIKGIEEKL